MAKVIDDPEFFQYLKNRFFTSQFAEEVKTEPQRRPVYMNKRKSLQKSLNLDFLKSLSPTFKLKTGKKFNVNSKIDRVPLKEKLRKENIKLIKRNTIKKTCLFRALESFHQTFESQVNEVHNSRENEYFD